jgi:hypothetical protein
MKRIELSNIEQQILVYALDHLLHSNESDGCRLRIQRLREKFARTDQPAPLDTARPDDSQRVGHTNNLMH